MNQRFARLGLLVLLGGLAACGSTPTPRDSGEPVTHFNPSQDPYWEDAKWDNALLDAVQSAVHDPADAADTSTPGFHATVKFTFLAGAIEYPEIIASTGNPDLDRLMLHQVSSAQVPQPTAGLQIDVPHEFVLDLDMPTPFESFQSSIYGAIDAQKIYPKSAIISAAAGNTRVDFDYQDGKASEIAMTASSHDKELDKVSVGAITKAAFPPSPAAYAGKKLHMQVLFCYTIASAENGSVFTIKNKCPAGRNVIVVQATRIKTTTVTTMH